MKKLYVHFSFLVISISILSCSVQTEVTPQETLELAFVKDIYLNLDNETSARGNSFYQLLDRDSVTQIAFFNRLNFNLYIYDLINGKLEEQIKFEKGGPDGLGDMIMAFHIAEDNKINFHSYYRSELIVANFSGEVESRLKMRKDDLDFMPVSSQNKPFIELEDDVFIYSGKTSNDLDFLNAPMLLRYNIKNNQSEDTGVRLPDLYTTGASEFIPGDLSEPSLTSNPEGKILLLSFPLDDSVKVISVNGEVKSVFFGINSHELESPLKKDNGARDPLGKLKDLLTFSRYGAVKYDPYRKIYLRTYIDKTPQNLLDQDILKGDQKIVFADSSLNVIGVADFIGTDNLLFSKEGMLQVMYNSQLEDSLQIKVFKYE
ncbi:DUF4221 family protein [Roseivirga echinicomitans]|uniref:DUF4221 domain-containing protein n=1 Tax=Roseivirga echinicomitans TaxID=296218 RepID=A0A150XJV8_9BACT|nr:DUF4221 family protein [Roseivirga echinicomitans]KYG78961.1 hypothetical protein AWN68_04850 [Roseivirga echinicomitans]